MAIDSRNKLFSLLKLHKPYTISHPDPTETFDQSNLQQLLHGYSGILWEVGQRIIGRIIISIDADKAIITTDMAQSIISVAAVSHEIIVNLDLE